MSNKHHPLTEAEVASCHLSPIFTSTLDQLEKSGKFKSRSEIRVLDWGCGRGRNALRLRDLGYSCYGVDIDPEPIRNGSDLFRKRNLKPEDLLKVISPEGKIDFPDNFFHLVISDQVFEHVADLRKVSREISRVTAVDGMGLHIYPAHRIVWEGHLFMPFVHWLPKNRSRFWLIYLFLKMGLNPRWEEARDKTLREQAEIYYVYCNRKTFYRSPRDVRAIFNENNLKVRFVSDLSPRLQQLKPLRALTERAKFAGAALNYLLTNFRQAYLQTVKPLS